MLVVPMPPQASHLHPPSTDTPSYSSPPPPTTTATPSDTRTKIASRPKLSLQTSSLPRTFGRSSTGLSLSVAAASPTVNNTFKNAYEPCPASAIPTNATTPSSSTASPAKSSNLKYSKPASPYPSYNSGNSYQLPLGVKSILRNSPLEHTTHRRSLSVNGGNGASGSRRVFFPTKKQVSYRQPLEEEIRTVHYVARHSDLIAEESCSDSQNQKQEKAKKGPVPRNEDGSGSDSDSNSSLAPSDSSGSDDDHTGSTTSLSKSERKKRKNLSAERQVRAVALLDGLESDPYDAATPQTPCQSRVKRRCEWRWTLGSFEARNEAYGLPGTPDKATSFAASETTTTKPISPESEWERKHPENDNETESLGSCDSDWTSTSLGSSVASHTTHPKSGEPKTHDA